MRRDGARRRPYGETSRYFSFEVGDDSKMYSNIVVYWLIYLLLFINALTVINYDNDVYDETDLCVIFALNDRLSFSCLT